MNSKRPSPPLSTTADVIAVLGGPTVVSRMLGFPFPSRVWNWSRGKFPANTYMVLSEILNREQIPYSKDLWAWLDPPGSDGSDRSDVARSP